jgi:hypothetical protein
MHPTTKLPIGIKIESICRRTISPINFKIFSIIKLSFVVYIYIIPAS